MVAKKLTPSDIWRRTFKQEKVKIILCHPAELGHFTCCLYPWYSLCLILARQLILERPSSGFGFEQSSIEALLIDPAFIICSLETKPDKNAFW